MSVVRAFCRRDAGQVAALLRREQAGPHTAPERPLDAAGLLAVLEERGVRRMQVAASGDDVIGSLGFFRTSGQRVAAPDEAFAGMFAIDSRHRGGLMAGRLFAESVLPLLDDGVNVLRTEVRPTNRRAAPLYARVGFVALDGTPADEDGYTELVSFLPRVLRELRARYPALNWAGLASGASWRSLLNRSGAGAGEPVHEAGRPVVPYRFAVEDAFVAARVDGLTGTLVGLDVTVTGAEPRRESAPPAPTPPAVVHHHRAGGPWYLVLHEGTGLLEVRHDAHPGTVLRDPWPVLGPPFLTGWRRPARRRLSVRTVDGGWHVTEGEPGARLHRETVLADGVLHQQVWWEGAAPAVDSVLVTPWHQLRQACLLTDGGRLPAVRGLCPEDLTDYEALSADRPHPACHGRPSGVAWWDPVGRLGLRPEWDEGAQPRFGSEALPALRWPLRLGLRFGYRVHLSLVDDPAQVLPDAAPGTLPGLRPADLPADLPVPAWSPRSPLKPRFGQRTLARRRVAVARTAEDEVLLSAPDGGVVMWRNAARRVLASPFPRRRALGSLTDWRSGLWVDRQPPRDRPETGLGWGETAGLSWYPAGDFGLAAGGLRWSLAPGPGRSWRLVLDGEPWPTDADVVVHLAPAAADTPHLLLTRGDAAAAWDVTPPPSSRSWGSACAVRLADGRWLACRPVRGVHQEVLCRVLDGGVLVSLASRHDAGRELNGAWELAVADGAQEAAAVLARRNVRRAGGACAS